MRRSPDRKPPFSAPLNDGDPASFCDGCSEPILDPKTRTTILAESHATTTSGLPFNCVAVRIPAGQFGRVTRKSPRLGNLNVRRAASNTRSKQDSAAKGCATHERSPKNACSSHCEDRDPAYSPGQNKCWLCVDFAPHASIFDTESRGRTAMAMAVAITRRANAAETFRMLRASFSGHQLANNFMPR